VWRVWYCAMWHCRMRMMAGDVGHFDMASWVEMVGSGG